MAIPGNEYDVIIVGGGPAGASASVHLARAGARVLLAERERFPRGKLCGEFISPECFAHFARLGVAGEIVRGVRLWVGGAEREFESALTIDATGRARVLARRVEKSGREDAGAHVGQSENGVGSGRRARGRERPRLVAFKAHLEGARGDAGACEIYFYRGGYGGLNSVEGGRSNLCFIAAAGDVRACGSDPERVLAEVLLRNRRAAETLCGARAVTPWLAVSLEGFGRFGVAPAPGLLAVGDAASFIDPFTGSGMLMALQGGELAAAVVAPRLAGLRRARGRDDDEGVVALAGEYRALYDERFGARLRVCATLRRAAFAPRWATEVGLAALGASAGLRRALARATRRGAAADSGA
ncbi:MAG: FAD-dependent oxidoreductase [Acidobacteria bacterium]|nr:FAD-dependent oxidoreductase [Acidobacteriota bacterium]